MRGGRLGHPLAAAASSDQRTVAEGPAGVRRLSAARSTRRPQDLPHVDRRLVEIARALATRPKVLLLDEPAAGLMRADKAALGAVLRRLAGAGLAVILVEHDMALVMGVSDHVVVLDAGRPIAAGPPEAVRHDPKVKEAYLGSGQMQVRPRAATAGRRAAAAARRRRPRGRLRRRAGARRASPSRCARASWSRCSAPTAPASPPPCAPLSGLLRPVSGTDQARRRSDRARCEAHAHRRGRPGAGARGPPGVSRAQRARQPPARRPHPQGRQTPTPTSKRCSRASRACASACTRRAGLLSGGEQQMLAIARGLMARPRMLLLDEPSLGLAPAIIDELFKVIAELRDSGITILLVDQMAAHALTAADRGYVLESGRIVRAESAAALRQDPALEAAYLGGLEGSGVVGWRSTSSCAAPASTGREDRPVDIGIASGRIAAIAPSLPAGGGPRSGSTASSCCRGSSRPTSTSTNRCIIDRCSIVEGTLQEAIAETARAKAAFTEADIEARARAHAGEGDPRRHAVHAHPRRGRSRASASRASTCCAGSSATTPGRSICRSASFPRKASSTTPAPRSCWSPPASRAPT